MGSRYQQYRELHTDIKTCVLVAVTLRFFAFVEFLSRSFSPALSPLFSFSCLVSSCFCALSRSVVWCGVVCVRSVLVVWMLCVGRSFEGLTCDAVEWISSHGGGSIIEADRTISLNNPATLKALTRAQRWVGTISPLNVIDHNEAASYDMWFKGNAAFLRAWVTHIYNNNNTQTHI